MKWIKSYSKYKESIVIDLQYAVDLMESLSIWHDALLDSIGSKEVDIFETFKLPKDFYTGRLDIDFLHDNIEFVNSLSSIALKISEVQSTKDFQCFINKPCKFMFIYGIEKNELERPEYILFQVWNELIQKWDEVKLYKVNGDTKAFYDKLSSKTIEILDGDENYIYTTSNVNEYELQNLDKENDIYKRFFRKDEFEKLLSDRKVKINVI
jgi:hypothetical protein